MNKASAALDRRDLQSLLADLCEPKDPARPRQATVEPARPDGRHVLRPRLCSVTGASHSCDGLPTEHMKLLHNEAGLDAAAYPVRACHGLFFSEALDAANPAAEDYLRLIAQTIEILVEAGANGPMSLAELIDCGRRVQHLDAAFADARSELPLDALHSCSGPDPTHPYAKITLCRTTIPIQISEQVMWFFFEKFLVSYSYLDEGVRRSTNTPIHSHPLNFETVYFRSFGPGARVTEQEYRLINREGVPLIDGEGAIDERFFGAAAAGVPAVRVEPGPKSDITPGAKAIRLEPFDMEVALRARDRFVRLSDGLFRPHRVTVRDDPETPTRYYALDNYVGPLGRVLLYGPDGASVWRHDDWD